MKPLYKKSILFWFVLSVIAFANAAIRETTYKPLLSPYIGMWAHQISSLTGILLLSWPIYLFFKNMKDKYSKKDLIGVGLLWVAMTLILETLMNVFFRKLTFLEVLATYYFWKGETWIFVLVFLGFSPLIADKILKK